MLMTFVYVGSIIAMVALSVLAVVSLRPRRIGERKGTRGVTWAGWSALAVAIGGAAGVGSMWVFQWIMVLLFHHIMGVARLWGEIFGAIMGGAAGFSVAVAIALGINESYKEPPKARRSRPPV
jgi:hypothetical protein